MAGPGGRTGTLGGLGHRGGPPQACPKAAGTALSWGSEKPPKREIIFLLQMCDDEIPCEGGEPGCRRAPGALATRAAEQSPNARRRASQSDTPAGLVSAMVTGPATLRSPVPALVTQGRGALRPQQDPGEGV